MLFKLFSIMLMLIFLGTANAAYANNLENEYLLEKNQYITRFSAENVDSNLDDQAELSTLERKLKKLIGVVSIEQMPKEGVINLETLLPELGFGMLDGLRFSNEYTRYLVTTPKLFFHFIDDQKYAAKDLASLSAIDNLYGRALFSDVFSSLYAPLKVKTGKSEHVYASLGLLSQDIGSWGPHEIFVLAKIHNRIYMVSDTIHSKPPVFPVCEEKWKVESKRDEDLAYSNFRKCYGEWIVSTEFYEAAVVQANKLIQRIAH